MQEIILRAEAMARGMKRYFTGRPCIRGHIAERNTRKKWCYQCVRDKHKEAAKRPEIAERKRKQQRRWYLANKDHCNAKSRDYYETNKERMNILGREYGAANKDKQAKRRRNHYVRNKPKYIAQVRARTLAIRMAMPEWADKKAIEEIYEKCREVSETTGIIHQVDHIVPLRGKTVCGLHVDVNLRIVPATVNYKKKNNWTANEERLIHG